ncbi:DUF6492 family protein [Paenibacillus abyssi]|uniref:Uncharacterized protein n=1 Tax=Paenibacillus abyssi TaxID=1340531 RepID=A0A917G0T2_9BACL|nr:DUF6492 family protein [Paenibacillus abyssi]GGG17046.1 hypothetical protein GCM10010916_37370 [Paenibacillus abyssi]
MSHPITNPEAGRQQIDVLIPAIEKDLNNLPYVIDSVRKMVKHPINDIFIVSPRSAAIEQLCRQKRCRFVNENTVLPITKKHIHYRSKSWDRSGWLFQQLLKLSGDSICSCSKYLVIDADTVLIRPHTFRSGSKTVAYYRKWSQPEYFRAYKKLLGTKAAAPVSFVAHYMLFDKEKVRQLKRTIEGKHQIPWYSAIIKNIRKSSLYAFSEFETYGNFVYAKEPGAFVLKSTLNKSLPVNAGSLTGLRIQKLAKTYKSLSFHKRRNYFLK